MSAEPQLAPKAAAAHSWAGAPAAASMLLNNQLTSAAANDQKTKHFTPMCPSPLMPPRGRRRPVL